MMGVTNADASAATTSRRHRLLPLLHSMRISSTRALTVQLSKQRQLTPTSIRSTLLPRYTKARCLLLMATTTNNITTILTTTRLVHLRAIHRPLGSLRPRDLKMRKRPRFVRKANATKLPPNLLSHLASWILDIQTDMYIHTYAHACLGVSFGIGCLISDSSRSKIPPSVYGFAAAK